jgi:hypothetical protein
MSSVSHKQRKLKKKDFAISTPNQPAYPHQGIAQALSIY